MVIEDAYRDYIGIREWIINVTRNLNDWEVGEYEELLQLRAMKQVNTNRDQVVWKLKQNDEFTV